MRIGIDFGGTKIEAAVIGEDGAFLARKREANPGGYEAAVRTVAGLVDAVAAAAPQTPRPKAMRRQPSVPWYGPTTSSSALSGSTT